MIHLYLMRKALIITLLVSMSLLAQVDTVKINQELQKITDEINQINTVKIKEANINIWMAKAAALDLIVERDRLYEKGNQLLEEKRKILSPKK